MLWAGGACQPWSATHLVEGKLQHQTSSGLREKTPRKDPESEFVRQFAAVHNLVPAIPAKPLMSACIDVCHSVGSIGGVERGDMVPGQQFVLHTLLPRPAPWRGYSSVASLRRQNKGNSIHQL